MMVLLLLIEWGLPFLAVATTVSIHHFAIRHVSVRMPVRGMLAPPPNMVRCVLILTAAHLLEIVLFAICYAGVEQLSGTALLEGDFKGDVADYLYYSATTYSSLGLGDVQPKGAVRLLTGVEALIGLIMIAWTAAFLFAETERTEGL